MVSLKREKIELEDDDDEEEGGKFMLAVDMLC
jgi:hypothetical protein